MTIADFLLARFAEDETAARMATRGRWWSWSGDGGGDDVLLIGSGTPGAYDVSGLIKADGDHIARHSPARVLAECDAKRRIVGDCRRERGDGGEIDGWGELADAITLHLAQPYANHPDFRPEWSLAVG